LTGLILLTLQLSNSVSIRQLRTSIVATMARQTNKSRRNEREVNQPQRKTSTLISGTQEVPIRCVPKDNSSIQQPVREAPKVKDAQNLKGVRAKQTVSAAGIFKKKPKANPRNKKYHRRREPTPEPDLIADFRGMVFNPY
jgi:hypothetical protein